MSKKSHLSLTLQQPAGAWKADLPNIRYLVQRAATHALDAGVKGGIEAHHFYLTIRLSDDAEVQELNAQFRGKDKPTNVLSFPFAPRLWHEGGLRQREVKDVTLGDMILAYETCAAEAKSQKKTMADHLQHLVVHGVLHLIGFDHEDDEEAAERMEALEIEVLARFGVANPY